MPENEYRPCRHGLTIVYTGDGKGKTTAALGLCVRAIGHGNKIAIIQFIKSDWKYGEVTGLKRLEPEVTIHTLGAGCIGLPGDNKSRKEHVEAARETLSFAMRTIKEGKHDIVILDEVHVAAQLQLIQVEDILDLISARPDQTDLVLTGRDAHESVIEKADLVTEMKEIKHPFQEGYLGKKGIDF